MSRRTGWAATWLVGLAVLVPVAWGRAQEVPPALAGWRDWVLTGQEHLRCPFFVGGTFGQADQHVCAWPGRLRLTAGASGGRFAISYEAFATTWLPLPGGGEHWPLEVRVDGAALPVVEHEGGPAVRVAAGHHQVEGSLEWERRPESLPVPESIALVDLTLDGKPVFPLQRSGGSLWLGQASTAAGQADSLSVQVYRKLTDGLPPLLETRLRLDVSGQGREAVLGPVLPEGFVPTGVESQLTALLGADGRLRVQLRPGNWQVAVTSRGLAPLSRLAFANPGGAWPAEEVWSYEARPDLRVTSAAGGQSVDPSQVNVPDEWRQLPAFVMTGGAALEVEQRSRGMADDANRLSLHRTVWLDFEGPGLTARDSVSGRMVHGFRLDLAEPFVLRRASAGNEPLLVTRGSLPGLTGVELRQPDVNLHASSRVERVSGALPVTGWQTPLENVTMNVQLPPGRMLLAAFGADSSPNAWGDRWSLLDVFLLLITTLLAYRLLGPAGGAMAFVFLGLSYHESPWPLGALLALVILALLHRALPAGRLAGAVAVLRGAALLALVLVSLPFVARQLRAALYPQLEAMSMEGLFAERGATGSGGLAPPDEYVNNAYFEKLPMNIPAAPAPQAQQVQDEVQQLEEKAAEVTSSLVSRRADKGKAAQRLQRYAASNVFQAGGGEPGWGWRGAELSWSGPVLPTQTVRLVITPAWLTRLLRVLMVGLLGLLLARLVRTLHGTISLPTPDASAAATVLLLLVAALPAAAQQTPDPALLEQLKQRLAKAPECAPACGHVEDAVVEVGQERLSVALTVHAAALVAMPVPSSEAAWQVNELLVDGASRPELLRQGNGPWVPLERGVHRVELRGRLLPVDSLDLRFPAAPARVTLRGSGWDSSGLREGRLLTDTLGLVRVRGAGEGGGPEGAAVRVPPFVQVVRDLDLDLDWSATTRVVRVAPEEGSLTVEVPLLPGESVLTPGFEARDGKVTAALGAGINEVSWQSRLERVDRLELVASDLSERAETWRVTVSPQWRVELSGVPASTPTGAEDYWVHEFHPLPGERLTLTVSRPEPVAGATLAIDQASLESAIGQRAGEHTLTLALRSTRGGQHPLGLPADAEVLEVKVDGSAVNLRPQAGRLTVPVHPGQEQVEVRWRDAKGAGLFYRTPAVDLGASASNLGLILRLPDSRWVLATSGPRIGPAVLFWGELLVMALVALLLARLGRSPLRFHHWLLLGLGFSTFSWVALTLVVVWLLALDARGRLDQDLPWWRFDLVQVALVGFTLVALGCLVAAVPYGLLGPPDMRITGNGSSGHELRWFADQTAGPLPSASAFSLPMWLYRVALLAWALWLASAIVGWLRWGFQCLTVKGGWPRRPKKPAVAAPVVAPEAPQDTQPG